MVELATPPGGTARARRDQLQERQRRVAAVDEGVPVAAPFGVGRARRRAGPARCTLWCHLPTGAVALDSTDISTWGRVRHRKPLVDADPDSPRPPDHPLAPPDPAHPHARRRGHHLPDAPTGADGRYIYTVDMDARMGWRSSEFEETIFLCGYDLHVITDVPSVPGRGPVVYVARAMNLSPAGSHKGIGDLPAVHALGDTIGKPRQLIADRAYNYVTNDTFALPVWELGYTTIYDLHPNQRGTHPDPTATPSGSTASYTRPPARGVARHRADRHQDGRRRARAARPPAPGPPGLRLRPARCPPTGRGAPLPRAGRSSGPGALPEQSRVDARPAQRADDVLHPGHAMRVRAHHHPRRLGLPGPADAVPARHPGLGGVLSPQGRDRECVRRPEEEPARCASRLLPWLRNPPLHPARRIHPRCPEHPQSSRLGHPAGSSRFLGAVPRRTGTRTPTPTAASQHSLRHAPRNISGRHGTGQMTAPPRHRNPRIPVVDLDHPPKMTHYRARVRQICCSHSSNVLHTDRRSGRRSVECAEIMVRIGSRV